MKIERQQAAGQQADKVNEHKAARPEPVDDHLGKKIQGEHIQEKVGHIYVQKAGGKGALALPGPYGTDIEFVAVEKDQVVKAPDAHQNIGGNKQNGSQV